MPGTALHFTIHADGRAYEETLLVRHAVIAGWTGRDKAALEKHIVELEELGVARPASTPIYYRVAAARLTTADAIECTGPDSSGEVEFMVVQSGGRRWLGIGSDHTDRKVETYGITVSKQMCDKPVAPELWALDEVLPHWDSLVLRAHAVIGGETVLYQEGSVAAMLPPGEILDGYAAGFGDGTAMFCGTLAARGGIRPAERFAFEIEDPVLGRVIRHAYDVTVLPIAG
ncbi:DUF2848 domain-containing protein [Xanthobacter dioxanivorans]|uniref:DUF2848 domain-containing protein n=1 Tax=Xanthobacter dioxanivorans TaxID=2528964 RepID=A0A974PQ20_9HYPH|nr:DUF2848 domain-containing protein [Xanthobacter dioxanivorans]QRG07637.1 DUF2848 domain-containing protein [Xanthobacter dioxanivorans]